MGAQPAAAEAPPLHHPVGPWPRLLAFGARWPRLFRQAHLLALYLVPLELVTGAALYFPRLHTALIPALPAIEAVHVWGGILFGILLVMPMVVPLGRRLAALIDWRFTVWLGAALTLTGLGLWTGGLAPILRSGSFTVHGLLAVALLAWVLYHGLVRVEAAIRGRDPERATDTHAPLRRRFLLAELGSAMVATLAGTALIGGVRSVLAALPSTPAPAPAPAGAGTAASGGSPAQAPGRPIPGFQLYTVSWGYPKTTLSQWRLAVEGEVGTPLSLSMADILKLPQVTEKRTFHCVTGWEVPNVEWVGVRIADVLAPAKPSSAGAWLSFDSFDGAYTDSLSLAQAGADGVLLAHHANGAPLAVQQGYPLRLLVPTMYGYKSVKWLKRIRVVSQREIGYWEQRGYGPDAYLGTVNGWPAGGGTLGGLLP